MLLNPQRYECLNNLSLILCPLKSLGFPQKIEGLARQLHRNRACALIHSATFNVQVGRAGDSDPVNAIMFVKPLIFLGENCVYEDFRDILQRHRETVFHEHRSDFNSRTIVDETHFLLLANTTEIILQRRFTIGFKFLIGIKHTNSHKAQANQGKDPKTLTLEKPSPMLLPVLPAIHDNPQTN